MSAQRSAEKRQPAPLTQILADAGIAERRLDLAGVATTVLEAGSGPPVVLLHGPGAYGAAWLPVMPALSQRHRVIAPDLPGQGTSTVDASSLDLESVLAWLDELVAQTCPSPPIVVGHLLGGAIAARYARRAGHRIDRLVLVVPLGLAAFQPSPAFGAVMMGYLQQPDQDTHDQLWRACVYDLDRTRRGLGSRWQSMKDYNLDRAQTPSVMQGQQRLMELFAMPVIPSDDLAAIAVPTTLIWGRHDVVVPVSVAEAASRRYGWPLRILDKVGNEPAIEAPDAFLQALNDAP